MLVAACSGHRTGHFDDLPNHAPKLVVLLVIDQWPEWSFEQKQSAFSKGFARIVTEGEWHVGHHPSAATLTAPGHALIGTGELKTLRIGRKRLIEPASLQALIDAASAT